MLSFEKVFYLKILKIPPEINWYLIFRLRSMELLEFDDYMVSNFEVFLFTILFLSLEIDTSYQMQCQS